MTTCRIERKTDLADKKCSHCKQSAAVHLPYAQRYLCKTHFFKHFEKAFYSTLSEFKMIKKGELIALGLSGGKDSIVLLNMLAALKKKLPYELIAITLDLGIGCDYNKETIKTAKGECAKLGVRHYLFNLKDELGYTLDEIIEKTKTTNPCSFCGVAKRYLLNKRARELGAKKLAIAHTINDSAETVLMNVLRNEPFRLFRYNEHLISDKMLVPRIKPFFRIPEDEVVAYGKLKGLPVLDKKCCPYSAFAFRKFVRMQIEELEQRYPGTRFRIVNSFLTMQKMFKTKNKKSGFRIKHCVNCGEPSSAATCKFCDLKRKLDGA